MKSMKGKWSEPLLKWILLFCASFSTIALICICGFLLSNGWPAIEKIGLQNFLAGTLWQPGSEHFGILPMICGSALVTLLAICIGAPLGILCAIWFVYYAHGKMAALFRLAVLLMAGIPSVVYGFFGLMVLVPLIRNTLGGRGQSLLCAGLLLGLMILPTIASMSITSLESVNKDIYSGSRALGASHEQSIFFSVLPAAKRGILSSVILGLGRAVGETMAVMMVAGNQPIFPESVLSGIRTLTANIAMEMGYASGVHREALIASGVILLAIVFVMNLILFVIQRKEEQ